MELKPGVTVGISLIGPVLIVPLWNWNSYTDRDATFDELVLIVPLWNWNEEYLVAIMIFNPVLIVPLWNWNAGCVIFPERLCRSLNRTFMELKLELKDEEELHVTS